MHLRRGAGDGGEGLSTTSSPYPLPTIACHRLTDFNTHPLPSTTMPTLALATLFKSAWTKLRRRGHTLVDGTSFLSFRLDVLISDFYLR